MFHIYVPNKTHVFVQVALTLPRFKGGLVVNNAKLVQKKLWSQIVQWPHKTAINGPHIVFLVPNLASSAKPKPISDKWCEPHIDQCSGSSYFWIRGDHVHCPSVQDLVFSHRSYLRENPEPTLGGLCRCDHTSNRSSSWGTEQVSELPASWLSAL